MSYIQSAGRNAFYIGLTRKANPYDTSNCRKDWLIGFKKAEADHNRKLEADPELFEERE